MKERTRESSLAWRPKLKRARHVNKEAHSLFEKRVRAPLFKGGAGNGVPPGQLTVLSGLSKNRHKQLHHFAQCCFPFLQRGPQHSYMTALPRLAALLTSLPAPRSLLCSVYPLRARVGERIPRRLWSQCTPCTDNAAWPPVLKSVPPLPRRRLSLGPSI